MAAAEAAAQGRAKVAEEAYKTAGSALLAEVDQTMEEEPEGDGCAAWAEGEEEDPMEEDEADDGRPTPVEGPSEGGPQALGVPVRVISASRAFLWLSLFEVALLKGVPKGGAARAEELGQRYVKALRRPREDMLWMDASHIKNWTST